MKFYDRANTSTRMQKSWFFEAVERNLVSSRKKCYQKQIYLQIQNDNLICQLLQAIQLSIKLKRPKLFLRSKLVIEWIFNSTPTTNSLGTNILRNNRAALHRDRNSEKVKISL